MDRVNEATKDCFNALVQIRALEANAQVSPEVLHRQMMAYIDALFQRGGQLGLSERDVQEVTYAIVALADEVALRKPGGVRDYWMSHPLQLHYFNENIAGENFFNRLEAIMADPSRGDVLRVYYLCLLFGFQGKFAVRGGDLELSVVQRRVKESLSRILRPEPLSSKAQRPKERYGRARQGFTMLWLALFALLFSLCLLIVLRYALDARTETFVERIQALLSS